MKIKTSRWVLGFQALIATAMLVGRSASAEVPACQDHGSDLSIDNARVVQLKQTAPLGKTIRAHVSGTVTRVFPDKSNSQGTSHTHFEIKIGEGDKDVLEVVYSEDFGDMPVAPIGAQVEACGDFINAYGKNNGYPPSPSGAIIHWVHRSNSAKHDSGFVVLDQVVYGYGSDRMGGRRH
jgi:hypothetical protein